MKKYKTSNKDILSTNVEWFRTYVYEDQNLKYYCYFLTKMIYTMERILILLWTDSFFESLAEDVSKNSICKMEINNRVGNMELSVHHLKVSEVYESIDLENHCDKNMTGLQSFSLKESRIDNNDYEEITSQEGKDAFITGSVKENVEQNLNRSDEDLVDIFLD